MQCVDKFKHLGLIMNKAKTKEMILATGRNKPCKPLLNIEGTEIERVEEYKYLGTTITSSLNFDKNWEQRVQKARKRLYMLHKLRYTQASSKIVKMTYSAYIKPVLTYHLPVLYNSLSKETLQKIKRIERAGKRITKVKVPETYNEKDTKNLCYRLFLNEDHPFNVRTVKLPSGRIRGSKWRTNMGRRSFRAFFTSVINTDIFSR